VTLPVQIGRYSIRGVLSQGGLAAVYRAVDPLDRNVALKVRPRGGVETVRDLMHRARATATFSHPAIPAVYEVGEHDDQIFIAMEYVEGETLADLIGRRVPIPIVTRLSLIAGLARGLAHAHRSGVVHRQLTPDDVIVDGRFASVKILNLGMELPPSAITGELDRFPLNYAAPERVGGEPGDPRSDIFAIGAVLYELLAYRRAFEGGGAAVLDIIVHAAPRSLTSIDPTLNPALDDIVGRALARRRTLAIRTQMAAADLAWIGRRLERPSPNDPTGRIARPRT
jgi:serine/threonine-protein kinase